MMTRLVNQIRSTAAFTTGAVALLVAAGYYAGANFGFILRFPPATPSVMWPPNAILTATLLLTPPRLWPIYLAAAFPAHLAANHGMDWPSTMVLAVFVTNCSEALIAASITRRLSSGPARLDSLHQVAIFLFGVVLVAPFVSSFFDAAVVSTLRPEPYWLVWRTRFFSNVLTELVIVPAVVTLAALPSWVWRTPPWRRAEAAALGAAVLILAPVVFGASHYAVGPGVPRSPVALLLPFLLWAAVRFGPGGASLSLLVTTLVAVTVTMQAPPPPTREEVIELQIFLGAISVPLLCLSALIEERRRAQNAVAERLRFEEMVSRLSRAFVELRSDEMDTAFGTWLQRLGTSLGLERLVLLRAATDGHTLTVYHRWTAPGVPSRLPEVASRVSRADSGSLSLLRDKPPLGPRSADGSGAPDVDGSTSSSELVIPLVASGRMLGGLVFDPIARSSHTQEAVIPGLVLIAEVFAAALARKETEDSLRESEAMKSAILTSLTTGVAVLDRDGYIITVNEGWHRLSRDGIATCDDVAIGGNYVDAYRRAMANGVAHASDALDGIEGVLKRSRSGFALEYSHGLQPSERWFAMAVVPLERSEGGAVVSHTDVTERRRAEMEAQRSRHDLAHFLRVSTMGELTASLAHELSQPLSGILTNAQAAQRLLSGAAPDLGEIREILSDIVDDDKRASEVIHRLRDLLRKRALRTTTLDVNILIRDVARLLGSDAVIRNVSFVFELLAEPAVVNGDRVQLQQVILNLLLNAMEATAEVDGADRTIVLRTETTDVDAVHITVVDAGPGLDRDAEAKIFEPFYTTKPAGMGMGLSIARSIVVAHDGFIWATNNRVRGATFHVALPLSSPVIVQ